MSKPLTKICADQRACQSAEQQSILRFGIDNSRPDGISRACLKCIRARQDDYKRRNKVSGIQRL